MILWARRTRTVEEGNGVYVGQRVWMIKQAEAKQYICPRGGTWRVVVAVQRTGAVRRGLFRSRTLGRWVGNDVAARSVVHVTQPLSRHFRLCAQLTDRRCGRVNNPLSVSEEATMARPCTVHVHAMHSMACSPRQSSSSCLWNS